MKAHKLVVEIELENAAFDDNTSGEVSRILSALSKKIRSGGMDLLVDRDICLMDVNGNKVGFCAIESE
jgi:hypothetical protein